MQALNEQARKSYDSAVAVFSGGNLQNLVATRGGLFPQELFVTLRRGAKGLASA